MKKVSFCFLTLAWVGLCSMAFGHDWDFRLGLASYPEQNLLLSAEVTRVFHPSKYTDLGIGGVFYTDFSQTIGPGAIARFKYWLVEPFALGASAELGYMLHQSTSNPNSYTYFIVGPVAALRVRPVFIQWEPGELFYQRTTQLVPLRFAFGLII
jgi:hypothetical protein